MVDKQTDGRGQFEAALWALQVEVANVGAHLMLDTSARMAYARQIEAMANELRLEAASGRITWREAAIQAQEARNLIMEVVRGRSTPVGLAVAQSIKREGRTLNELIARRVQQVHGATARFDRLTVSQQSAIYADIVKSAGKSNPRITATMRQLSRAGRGLIVLSLAVSVYHVATADNKMQAAERELVVTGAGIGGGIAGGALAGLACGPGAPVCVAVGAFAGGVLAAFGMDLMW